MDMRVGGGGVVGATGADVNSFAAPKKSLSRPALARRPLLSCLSNISKRNEPMWTLLSFIAVDPASTLDTASPAKEPAACKRADLRSVNGAEFDDRRPPGVCIPLGVRIPLGMRIPLGVAVPLRIVIAPSAALSNGIAPPPPDSGVIDGLASREVDREPVRDTTNDPALEPWREPRRDCSLEPIRLPDGVPSRDDSRLIACVVLTDQASLSSVSISE
jgi:hypothetical protein